MNPADPWHVPGAQPAFRGKVRDIYDLGDRLLIVATDRISAYDVVLPDPIPDRGAILTVLTAFWLEQLGDRIDHHLISIDPEDFPEPFRNVARSWGPRAMLVTKLEMVPLECVVRGYLAGSGWQEYRERGTVCSIGLPVGLGECDELEHPLFTPATKAAEGHDENISPAEAAGRVGKPLADELERRSLEIYEFGRTFARERGLLLADTKFEFGLRHGAPVLADEVLTPDSSRFWPADSFRPGTTPPSFDKQFVRDHLNSAGWDRTPPAPRLPEAIIEGTAERYRQLYERLTGTPWGKEHP